MECPPSTHSTSDNICEICNPPCSNEVNLISIHQDFSSKTKQISFPFKSSSLSSIVYPLLKYLFLILVILFKVFIKGFIMNQR